jgi:hypothetical protein
MLHEEHCCDKEDCSESSVLVSYNAILLLNTTECHCKFYQLAVCPAGMYSQCTLPLVLKNRINIVFSCENYVISFISQRDELVVHWSVLCFSFGVVLEYM